jgi:cytochrome c5
MLERLTKYFRHCHFIFLLTLCIGFIATEAMANKDGEKTPVEAMSDDVVNKLYLDNIYPKYPKITPPSGVSMALAKRGEYLAKIGDCLACHTNTADIKKGEAYAGGLAIATPFGTFYSPNLTPDKETGIGSWTEDDFIHALHDGKRKGGANLFPVFPYLYFSKTSTNDVRALYAYFRSIPAVKRKNDSQGFPFNMPGARSSLLGWNMLFFWPNKGVYQYDSAHSKEWNRGAYIVNSLGHCSMCHTELNVFGAPKQEYFLTGAFVDGYWAPNISSAGLRSANHFEVSDVFKENKLINNAGIVAGPMADVNHNSLRHLTNSDMIAVADYLKTVTSRQRLKPPVIKGEESMLKRGKQVYVNVCTVCHQNGKMGAPFIGNGNGWFDRIQTQGLQALYRHAIHGYNSMPYRGACVTCTDKDVKAAVDYMLAHSLSRSQWHDLKYGKSSRITASGEDVYNENCAICHNDGHQGAPKLGDKSVWKPIIEKNLDIVFGNVINGPNHVKKGGCKHCTSSEVISAIKYMVGKGKSEGNYTLW